MPTGRSQLPKGRIQLPKPVPHISIFDAMQVFSNPDNAEEEGRQWALLFLAVAAITGVAAFLHTLCFAISGEALTYRLRSMSFKAIIKQVCWVYEVVESGS